MQLPVQPDARMEGRQFSLRTLLLVTTLVAVWISFGLYVGPIVISPLPALVVVWLLVRHHWAWVVVGLYALLLIVLALPLVSLAFQTDPRDDLALYSEWPFWIWLDVMLVCQASLLVVPVASTWKRPLRKRSLLAPILASGLLFGLLVLGAVASVHEFFTEEMPGGYVLTAAGVSWLAWSLLFGWLARRREPQDVVARMCRLLLAGSVLELLVAVPTHVVARYRNYCCAGFSSFVGLSFGIAVMLASFGPAVFFLFLRRYRQLQPPPRQAAED